MDAVDGLNKVVSLVNNHNVVLQLDVKGLTLTLVKDHVVRQKHYLSCEEYQLIIMLKF